MRHKTLYRGLKKKAGAYQEQEEEEEETRLDALAEAAADGTCHGLRGLAEHSYDRLKDVAQQEADTSFVEVKPAEIAAYKLLHMIAACM